MKCALSVIVGNNFALKERVEKMYLDRITLEINGQSKINRNTFYNEK